MLLNCAVFFQSCAVAESPRCIGPGNRTQTELPCFLMMLDGMWKQYKKIWPGHLNSDTFQRTCGSRCLQICVWDAVGKVLEFFLVFPCKGGICKWSSSQIWSWALKGLFCNQLIKILVVVKHYAGKKPSASPGSYCHCHSFRVLFVHAFSLFRSHSGSQKSIASNSISLNLELNPPAISHELMLYHLVSVHICIQ